MLKELISLIGTGSVNPTHTVTVPSLSVTSISVLFKRTVRKRKREKVGGRGARKGWRKKESVCQSLKSLGSYNLPQPLILLKRVKTKIS